MPLLNPFPDADADILLEEEIVEDIGVGEVSHLIVYNDDENTFEWVIKSFIDVLEHSSKQAEQLSIIIHTKGKATVKTASKKELRPKKDALIERGLSAVIEEGS